MSVSPAPKWSEKTLSVFAKREQLSKIKKRIDELKIKWGFTE
jgi:hypothetical protein